VTRSPSRTIFTLRALRRGSLAIAALIVPAALHAQAATVSRDVNLRSAPSTANPPIELLHPGATLTLLTAAAQSGYYHVKVIADGNDGWVWSRNVAVAHGSATDSSAQCDASLWAHVYNADRLIVHAQCIAITGTIVDATNGKQHDGVRHEKDGDTHGWLKLDASFDTLINNGNRSKEGSNLVFEIVCRFHVTQNDAKAACPASYHTSVTLPPVGSHVRMVGSYVMDNNHDKWMEIHPVTSITVIP
jgi:uncharacterized protein YraI